MQVIERAIFNEKQDRAESTDPSKYDTSISLKYRIRLIILRELYCEKMPPQVTEKSLKKWQELAQAYTNLEKTLCNEAEATLREGSEETLQSEIRKLEIYIQKTGLEGSVEESEFFPEIPAKSSTRDFLKLIAEVKKRHLSVSLRESQDCINSLTEKSEELVNKIKENEENLSRLKEKEGELNDNKLSLEKSFTWLERWGLEDINKQANVFKQLVFWVYNFFSSQRIQDRSLVLSRQIRDAYSASTENVQNISNLKSEIKELKRHHQNLEKDLNEAKKRNATALKLITPKSEPTVKETDEPLPIYYPKRLT
ncbi:hypothetical protein B6N58_13490 [Legionella micdadei]|uniref:Uncharacterized protein n=1 Tax=Legionella micdadei TaxID=451 RepID=A0A1G5IDN0_LEGMI|nr:hypothetical protein B6N58_13490 [Legionella micdadei]ARH01332.1 hypothetical protein B6V88_13490 [Legionella micdadei]KTD27449.1 hypothetical protein Lmic_2384 [Legionella micdadei]SCY73498.1 hypothetical protein SAMN02982997_02701 [Legionella micdadei]